MTNHFSSFALAIDLAESGPFAELLVIVDLDQVDLMFGTEGLNQLDVPTIKRDRDINETIAFVSISKNRQPAQNALLLTWARRSCRPTRTSERIAYRGLWQPREDHEPGHRG